MCHKKIQQRAIVALVCVWIVCATHSQHAHSADSPPSFENDIAPILRTYCAGCHNDRDLEGELSVETFGSLRRGGASAVDPIVSGNGAESIMLKRIASDQPDKMPPEDEPQLPKKEIETLARWISAGAAGPARDLSILQSLVVPVIPSLSASQPITAAAWSPNGKKFAAARARTVTVYEHLPEGDPFKGAVSLTIDHLPGKVNALHFDSTGEKIVLATGITGLSGKAQIRSASTGAIESEWAGHRDVLYDAEISPDGSMLATAGYDRVIRLWKIADGSQVIAIDIHKGAIFDLAWHPSGTILASASADETVKLWRMPDGVRLDTLKEPQAEISNVLFTHDGNHILAAGRDKRIHMWQLISRDAPAVNPVIHTRFAHESPIAAIALSLDGRHLATSFFDRSIKLWSLPELALEQAFPRHSDIASVVCAAPSVTAFNKDQGKSPCRSTVGILQRVFSIDPSSSGVSQNLLSNKLFLDTAISRRSCVRRRVSPLSTRIREILCRLHLWLPVWMALQAKSLLRHLPQVTFRPPRISLRVSHTCRRSTFNRLPQSIQSPTIPPPPQMPSCFQR